MPKIWSIAWDFNSFPKKSQGLDKDGYWDLPDQALAIKQEPQP